MSHFFISHVAFFISHVAFFFYLACRILYLACRIFYLACRIFYLACRIFYLASRIFISHLAFFYLASCIFYLASRIFISHVAFFISHVAFFISHLAFLSRISHFLSRISHLAFLCRIYLQKCFSSPTESHLECPLQASVGIITNATQIVCYIKTSQIRNRSSFGSYSYLRIHSYQPVVLIKFIEMGLQINTYYSVFVDKIILSCVCIV